MVLDFFCSILQWGYELQASLTIMGTCLIVKWSIYQMVSEYQIKQYHTSEYKTVI